MLIVVSAIFGTVGTILAIIFYIKSKRVKKLKTATRSINLFKQNADKIDSLEILCSKVAVSNVTITKLALWNYGNETINSIDIAAADPLIIKIKDDFNILEYKMIYVKNKSNKLELNEIKNGKQISVNFDYLDKNEGGVIQILHTGNSSCEIEFNGTIKGYGKVNDNFQSTINNKLRLKTKFFNSIIIPKKVSDFIKIVVGYISMIMGIIIFMLGS